MSRKDRDLEEAVDTGEEVDLKVQQEELNREPKKALETSKRDNCEELKESRGIWSLEV